MNQIIRDTFDQSPTCIDLFCGAGGATSGIQKAGINVVAAINHDPLAIESHKANHPGTTHYNEDIRGFDVSLLPNKVDMIWMSAECTHLSNAKGGLPRDADSRTLSEELPRYVLACNPDYIFVENVREFLSWGPLNKKGKPISKLNGRDYLAWVRSVEVLGYHYDFRILNSADFGAYTSRSRYFGIFARKGLPIRWPQPTHSKTGQTNGSLFTTGLERWKAVREILDLEDHGRSVLNGRPNRPLLSPNTLARIEYGLNKYASDPKSTHLLNGNFRNPPIGVDGPIGTLLASRRHWSMVQMVDRYNFKVPPTSLNDPLSTVMAKRDQYLTSAFFINYNGAGNASNKYNVGSIDEPVRTITTKDRFCTTQVQYMIKKFSQANGVGSLHAPLPTIMTKPHDQIVSAKFLTYYYGGGKGNSNSRVGWIGAPVNVLATSHTPALIQAQFLSHYYSGGGQVAGMGSPTPSILTIPKERLVTTFLTKPHGGHNATWHVYPIAGPKHTITTFGNHQLTTAFLDASYGGGSHSNKYNVGSLAAPIGTLTTNPKYNIIAGLIEESIRDRNKEFVVRLAKSTLHIPGTKVVPVKVKKLWTLGYRISESIQDLYMRMLNVPELLAAQGFPANYILKGSTTHQKKFIGNSVVPLMARVLTEVNFPVLQKARIAV